MEILIRCDLYFFFLFFFFFSVENDQSFARKGRTGQRAIGTHGRYSDTIDYWLDFFFEYDFISSQLLNIILLYFMYFISGLDFNLKVPPQPEAPRSQYSRPSSMEGIPGDEPRICQERHCEQ